MDYETKNGTTTLGQVALKFFLKISIGAVQNEIPEEE